MQDVKAQRNDPSKITYISVQCNRKVLQRTDEPHNNLPAAGNK